MIAEQISFSLPQILSVMGLAQCVYVVVYMVFRAGNIMKAMLPLAYFLVLGGAFFLDFAARFISDSVSYYDLLQWAMWFMGPPLSVLLVLQIVRITESPSFASYWVLLLVPIAYFAALFMAQYSDDCDLKGTCEILGDWLVITGLIASAVSLLTIWMHWRLLTGLKQERAGTDRYWLVITLVTMNALFLAAMLFGLSPLVSEQDMMMVRTIIGLGLVYIAGTSLFRIYPQAVRIVRPAGGEPDMSREEKLIAEKIESLLKLEKIYHEPSYSRSDLARELEVAESMISRVINLHFGKSFPQLLNENRVEDAKRMLRETDAGIKVIANEVGFNSTASFNRVFKDMTGVSPSDYRSNT